MSNLLRIGVIGFISLYTLLVSCSTPVSIPDPGVPYSLAEQRAKVISEVEYNLKFIIPEEKQVDIEAAMDLTFTYSEPQDLVLDFHSNNGYVKEVSIEGKVIQFLDSNQHIIVSHENFSAGTNRVHIEFIAGNLSLNRNKDYLYTLLVPARASTVFPVMDQPNIKATFTLELEIPAHWDAMANGKEVENQVSNDRKIIKFQQTEPLPTYLFAFAAGAFNRVERVVDGIPMAMLHRESDSLKVSRNLDEIFQLHASSVKWLEEYTQIEYPFHKFGFALIPSFQYGGMEHPGSIFYNAESLFLDENPSLNRQLGRASLIAHETAHMWFGDLVTMNWFDDVWLKEVFANFMAAKIVNPQFPEVDHDLRFVMAYYRRAYGIDRTQGTHPVKQELSNLNDAGSLYGAIIYQKAPVLMKHLEMLIGEEGMRKGLQEYLKQYSYGNAVWDDLVKIMDKQSKQDISAWSTAWVYGKGMPVISYDISVGGEVEFHTLTDKGNQKVGYHFILPSDTLYRVIEPVEEMDVISPGTPNVWVLPNVDLFGYGYFKQDSLSRRLTLYTIKDLKEAPLRAVQIINMFEAFLRNDLAAKELLNEWQILIDREENPQILSMLLSQVQNLYWNFLPEHERTSLAETWEDFLWNKLITSENPSRVKEFYRSFQSIAISENALKLLLSINNEKILVKGLVLSESDRVSLVYKLALFEVTDWQGLVDKQYQDLKNADRKAQMAFVMGALSNSENDRDRFFDKLKDEANREHEPWVQQSLALLNHPRRQQSAVKYIRPGLELLQEIQATGDIFFPQRWLSALFSGHSSTEAKEEIEKFLQDNPDFPEKLRNKILQEADDVYRRSAYRSIQIE